MRSPRDTLVLRPRVQAADETLRPTRAEIDLGAIAHNLRVVKRVSAGARVLAVVKADGYGHGVVPVARLLQAEGADGFGVALAEEALELREAGITTDIVVLNGVVGGAHDAVIEADLTPVVYELAEARAFCSAARRVGRSIGIDLKVDTGMSRLGVQDHLLGSFLDTFEELPGVHISGCMTHLATADSDEEIMQEQLRRFDRAVEYIRERGHQPRTLHAANSAATFRNPRAHYDMVRPGIALFGYVDAPGPESAQLRPAMRLRTEIISLRQIQADTRVGYDGTFVASRSTRVATIPLGYGDGLIRRSSNRGTVLVRGQACPVIGNVSMDLTAVDVTEVAGVGLGDEVVLMGAQGSIELTARDVAEAAGTLHYEVLTNVSRRVPRFYR